MSLAPRGMSIQEAYRLYSEKKISVNRKYQRKLVWSESEKRRLVDSIQKELPIPLFMLAKNVDHADSYEVIDGMQRLNAIFSFIENQFLDESSACFDIEQYSRAKLACVAGDFSQYAEDVKRLNPDECAKFLDYQLAVTIDTSANESRINEVFGRINSGGRQLSPQEQRQAGLVSDFSEFVRMICSEIRGDSSPEVLLLNTMPEISFNTPKQRQRYGIDANDVFWCKHGIISANNLARSEDEQFISDIAISILNEKPLNTSREVLDTYFDPSSEDFSNLQTAFSVYGSDKLKREIMETIGAIRGIFEENVVFPFRKCVSTKPRNTARTTFYAVFMAFHSLLFKEGRFPNQKADIRNALNDVQSNMTPSAHYTKTEDRQKNIDIVYGLVQKHFVKMDVNFMGSGHILIGELENSLRRSKHEASRYEFKVGCCTLERSSRFDPGVMKKVCRTACAIANANPGSDGFIYFGVADNESDAQKICNIFSVDSIQIGHTHFVGVQHDLDVLKCDFDSYLRKIVAEIQKQNMDTTLRAQLTTQIDHAEYRGRPFIRIRVPAQKELRSFEDQYPVRKNSETCNMSPVETLAQAKLFQ